MIDKHPEPEAEETASRHIEFAEWHTPVEDGELQLVDLKFHVTSSIGFPQEGFSLRSPQAPVTQPGSLEATFLCREKRSVAHFQFDAVAAFRVLDEHGLVDMWTATAARGRPGSSTFRVRGHQWQEESFLVWLHGTDEEKYSYMVATAWDCLEVVTHVEPKVRLGPAVVSDYDPSEFR